MLIVTMACGQTSEQVFGCIGCEQISAVNDYQLVASSRGGDHCVTTLSGYSRWTEPAYALLARLLRHHPRASAVDAPGPSLRSTIHLGQSLANGRPIERLEAHIVDGCVQTTHHDGVHTRRVQASARAVYPQPVDLLEHAVRIAMWRIDAEPPIPPPLTQVRIYYDGGPPYVLAAEIPPFARRHFKQRRRGCTVPRTGTYYASDWWQFIGGRP